jgi:hypothetical protein
LNFGDQLVIEYDFLGTAELLLNDDGATVAATTLPLETLDKYDVVLPNAASFTLVFGDQLVIEYDFLGIAELPLHDAGATVGAAKLPVPLATLDKYDVVLPVAASFTLVFGDQLIIEYDFLGIAELPVHDAGATVGAAKLPVPLDTLDKYDVVLPVAASFTLVFGDQLVIEYDFLGIAELPVHDAGATVGATTLPVPLDTLDKYDVVLPVAASFNLVFGDQLVIEYDFLGIAELPVHDAGTTVGAAKLTVPLATLDKYDVVLPVAASFTLVFGDQLVIEYDFLGIAELPVHDAGATVGAAKLPVPLDTLDKYDVVLPVVASFTLHFGDQLVIAYDFLGTAELLLNDDGATVGAATFPLDTLDK